MVKKRICLCKTTIVLLTACAALSNTPANAEDAQSVPAYEWIAVLRQQCTAKDWQFQLRIGTKRLAANQGTRDVLIKASAQGEHHWTQRYSAGDILVRDCDAEQRICMQAKAASLHFHIGPDGLPRAGTLMLVSAKRQLIAQRFNVRMEEPENACRPGVRS